MAKITSRFRHYIAKLVVTRPAMVDRYVWLRMTPRAAELLNAKFDVKAPRNLRMAKDDYEWKRWDFFAAAKYFFNFKPETIAAVYTCWFNSPGFDPKFKPSVLLNLWLTVPLFVLAPPGLTDEQKEERHKEMEQKINDVVHTIGESNPDLTADLLRNMSVEAAVKFLEKTNAPPILMVLRKILPFEVTVKLLNVLRQTNPERFKFWIQRFPIEDVAKAKMKLLEIDRMAIEEFKLENEKVRLQQGKAYSDMISLQKDNEPVKQDAERVRYINDRMKYESMIKKREKREEEKQDSIEAQQEERKANLEKSVAELAKTLTDVIKQYRQEEEEPAKPIQSAGDKGG